MYNLDKVTGIAESPYEVLEIYGATLNIASALPEDVLAQISMYCKTCHDTDKQSMQEYIRELDDIYEAAAVGHKGRKMSPWPNCSNTLYPMIMQGVLNFSAVAYPVVIPSGQIVSGYALGVDTDGSKAAAAERAAEFMSDQHKYLVEGWLDQTDQMLTSLALKGTMYRKRSYDPIKGFTSDLVFPDEFIINHKYTRDLYDAPHYGHEMYVYPWEILERVSRGIFLEHKGAETEKDPILLVEHYTGFDLDGDGFREPYIVTMEEKTGKVLRIAPRYKQGSVTDSGSGYSIVPDEHFVRYMFMPPLDGGAHGVGLGHLLHKTNRAATTILNLLIDAGVASNMSGGLIGGGIRLSDTSTLRRREGEWHYVQSIGALGENVMPWPIKEPSQVLYQLLIFLVRMGSELAGTSNAGFSAVPENVSGMAAMNVLEGGRKMTESVFKRVVSGLNKEFMIVQKQNRDYLSPELYAGAISASSSGGGVRSAMVPSREFSTLDFRFVSAADLDSATKTQKMQKAQALVQLVGNPVINQPALLLRIMDAYDVSDAASLIAQPPAPDPMAMQAAQMELQKKGADIQRTLAETDKLYVDTKLSEAKVVKTLTEAQAESEKEGKAE